MKIPSWEELERIAAEVGLQILRRPMSLSIYTQAPLVISRVLDLGIGDFEHAEADVLMRGIAAAAIINVKIVHDARR